MLATRCSLFKFFVTSTICTVCLAHAHDEGDGSANDLSNDADIYFEPVQGAKLGGRANEAYGDASAVAGGAYDYILEDGSASFIGGGWHDGANALFSAVVGGTDDHARGRASFLGGGNGNVADGASSFIGGGFYAEADGDDSFVGGGGVNSARGIDSAVVGGRYNYASGEGSAVVGGRYNSVRGSFSFAVGSHANASEDYTAVFALDPCGNYSSQCKSHGEGTFSICAPNGFYINGVNIAPPVSSGAEGRVRACLDRARGTSTDFKESPEAPGATAARRHRQGARLRGASATEVEGAKKIDRITAPVARTPLRPNHTSTPLRSAVAELRSQLATQNATIKAQKVEIAELKVLYVGLKAELHSLKSALHSTIITTNST